jgi:hypothetical protein
LPCVLFAAVHELRCRAAFLCRAAWRLTCAPTLPCAQVIAVRPVNAVRPASAVLLTFAVRPSPSTHGKGPYRHTPSSSGAQACATWRLCRVYAHGKVTKSFSVCIHTAKAPGFFIFLLLFINPCISKLHFTYI